MERGTVNLQNLQMCLNTSKRLINQLEMKLNYGLQIKQNYLEPVAKHY